MADVQEWLRGQTGGRHLRLARGSDGISVVTVNLSDNGANRDDVLAEIYEQLGKRTPLAVFGEGEFSAASGSYETGYVSCAHGGRDAVMLSIVRCRPHGSIAVVVAHEMVHMLGAVPDCAPNIAATAGVLVHVDDARNDIMYYQHTGIPLSRLILDVGRDDYYMHGRDDCYDIAVNPLFVHPDSQF